MLPLFLFTWPYFPGWPGTGTIRAREESTAPLKSSVVLGRAPFSTVCATSATSCSREPNGPDGPVQPQLSPVRAYLPWKSPAWPCPCKPRTCQERRGCLPLSQLTKSFLYIKAQAYRPLLGEMFPSYSPLSWPHEVLPSLASHHSPPWVPTGT